MTAPAAQATPDVTRREPVRVIALSREYGAGGSELGVLLGEQLGWPVLDRELARRIAARLRCRCEDVELVDEHAPTLLERIAAAFTVVPSDAPVLPDAPGTPDPDAMVHATRAVVLEAARTPPLVIIGHGATCLLRDRRDLLRVRVTAPFHVRVHRVASRTGVSARQAADDVRRRDWDRKHYLERYYRQDTNDPNLYDMQINTATIPLETAARMVVSLVRDEAASR
ncbi:MAG TPA: cytidylate kinase-like family protein [Gemmatimonadaceae bacterium]